MCTIDTGSSVVRYVAAYCGENDGAGVNAPVFRLTLRTCVIGLQTK